MSLALVLLAGATLPAGLPNLDFSLGKLAHWEGQGFSLGPASGSGPSSHFGVCSADNGKPGRTALLHRTFTVPPGTTAIRFQAAAYRPAGCGPRGSLDIILEAAGREIIPKRVREAGGDREVSPILPPSARRPREYLWDVSAHAGRLVRIALIDTDARAGCFVHCGGFRLVSAGALEANQFASDMRRLQKEARLGRLTRLDSKHFLALGNASEDFMEYRLSNCEVIHASFFSHFKKKGFSVREPPGKLMVAVFDSQAGFEAYLKQKTSSAVTGLYHPESNRLVVYDFAGNRAFLAGREKGKEMLQRAATDLERERLSVALSRFENDRRTDTNVSTVMHEVAHQLSFNCGMLNRKGDVPLWLAEGLACYCESTAEGAWQGIGEPNPSRAAVLARAKGAYLPLQNLIGSDDWLRKAERVDHVLLGYSQSWALFSWLMRERPRQLRRYLELIYPRRTPEQRLADFGSAFGGDLPALERQYRAYLREVARDQAR